MRLPSLSSSLHFTFLVQPLLQELQEGSFAGIQLEDYAVTECDLATGLVTTTQLNRKGYGSPIACLDAHENTHINYQLTCCAKAKKCFDKTTDNSCVNRFRKWHKATINHNECLAYTAEIQCLENALLKGYSPGTVKNINKRLVEARDFARDYCKNAVQENCPFDNNGNIIS
jgi:hypothetical protein